MPPPIPVELYPYDLKWAQNAVLESERLAAALDKTLITVHHIGSTAIPGIRAKPILDLLPIVTSLPELDDARALSRRYCNLDDPLTGLRKIQLHFYERNSPEIARHLAFRDYLRSRPDVAREYDAEKGRCRELHPLDSYAYTDCKSAWIRRVEAEALSKQSTKPL